MLFPSSDTDLLYLSEPAFEKNCHCDMDEPIVEECLPLGWEERKDIFGRIFYVDHYRRSTTWNHPNSQNANTTQWLQVDDNCDSHKMRTSDELGLLPPFWTTAYDLHGHKFFLNHIFNITTWIDPRTSPSSLQSMCHPEIIQNGPLPDHWEVNTEPTGRYYYIDHINKTTTWENPRVSSSSQHECCDSDSTVTEGKLPSWLKSKI